MPLRGEVSTPSVTEFPAVCDVVRAEQDTDITVEFRRTALSGSARTASPAVLGQVPPELLRHAFLRVDIPADRLLADPECRAFVDQPVADLLGGPAILDAVCAT